MPPQLCLLRPSTDPAPNNRGTAAADLAVAKVEVTSSVAESPEMTTLAMVSERYGNINFSSPQTLQRLGLELTRETQVHYLLPFL